MSGTWINRVPAVPQKPSAAFIDSSRSGMYAGCRCVPSRQYCPLRPDRHNTAVRTHAPTVTETGVCADTPQSAPPLPLPTPACLPADAPADAPAASAVKGTHAPTVRIQTTEVCAATPQSADYATPSPPLLAAAPACLPADAPARAQLTPPPGNAAYMTPAAAQVAQCCAIEKGYSTRA